jgi:predicted MFS family arabinose efflux permease
MFARSRVRLKKKTAVLLMLAGLAIITFLDRICIAVAGPRIQDDLHITPEKWGWILGAFVLSYGLFEIPTGALGDRTGQRSVLTRIVVWWSAFTSLTGAALNFPQLLAARFFFGAGEAGMYPNASGVVARWFPADQRGRAQGAIWAASRFGGALTPLLVVPLQMRFGWRTSFWIFGAVGLVWAAVWHGWYRDRDPEQSNPAPAVHVAIPWSRVVRSRPLWLIFAAYWAYSWGSWFYFAWLPTYLVRGAGFTEAEMGIFSALPFLLGTAANLIGGVAGDLMARRFGLKIARRGIASGSLAVASLLILAMAFTRDKRGVVILSSLGFGVMDLMLPTAWALCLDVGRGYAGVVTGVMNTAGQFGGFVCTVLFGYIVKATGSYNAPLWVVAAMVMTGAILFSQVDPTRQLFEERSYAAAQ